MTAPTAVSEEEVAEVEERDPLDAIGDLDSIIPSPGKVVIQGIECNVRHLKAREFFMLMEVISMGLGPAMGELRFNSNDPDEIAGTIAGALFIAIPRATNQFLELVEFIVEPVGTKDEKQKVKEHLLNPEIEDLFPIIDAIIENEKDNFASLVGKAKAYMARWKKTVNAVRQQL